MAHSTTELNARLRGFAFVSSRLGTETGIEPGAQKKGVRESTVLVWGSIRGVEVSRNVIRISKIANAGNSDKRIVLLKRIEPTIQNCNAVIYFRQNARGA